VWRPDVSRVVKTARLLAGNTPTGGEAGPEFDSWGRLLPLRRGRRRTGFSKGFGRRLSPKASRRSAGWAARRRPKYTARGASGRLRKGAEGSCRAKLSVWPRVPGTLAALMGTGAGSAMRQRARLRNGPGQSPMRTEACRRKTARAAASQGPRRFQMEDRGWDGGGLRASAPYGLGQMGQRKPSGKGVPGRRGEVGEQEINP
jgi:hypothetical protein